MKIMLQVSITSGKRTPIKVETDTRSPNERYLQLPDGSTVSDQVIAQHITDFVEKYLETRMKGGL